MSPRLQAAESRMRAARAHYLRVARESRAGLIGRAQVTSAGQSAYRAQTELERLRKESAA